MSDKTQHSRYCYCLFGLHGICIGIILIVLSILLISDIDSIILLLNSRAALLHQSEIIDVKRRTQFCIYCIFGRDPALALALATRIALEVACTSTANVEPPPGIHHK